MESGTYKIADTVFALHSLYSTVQDLCYDYRSNSSPEFELTVCPADIAYERNTAESDTAFSDAYLETLAVLRKLAEALLDKGILLFHGSALALDGTAYLFTAPSGTGKSTHAGLWREEFGSRICMINDDKPFVKVTQDGAVVYGSPWNGKHRLSTNTCAPLKCICLLQRDEQNRIEPISPADAFPTLMKQCHCPTEPASTTKALHLLGTLTRTTAFYRLWCNREREAARIAWHGMNGQGSTTIEETLQQVGVLVTTSAGSSMLPLIRSGKDLLEIRPKGRQELRCDDIALFCRNGKYVLHRVIAVKDRNYTFRGDNALRAERGVSDADVLGVLHSIQRSGKHIVMDSIPVVLYGAVWRALYPARALYMLSRQLYGRIRRSIKGEQR